MKNAIMQVRYSLNGYVVKGYFHYKTITSQNVPSEAHVKIFFVS